MIKFNVFKCWTTQKFCHNAGLGEGAAERGCLGEWLEGGGGEEKFKEVGREESGWEALTIFKEENVNRTVAI